MKARKLTILWEKKDVEMPAPEPDFDAIESSKSDTFETERMLPFDDLDFFLDRKRQPQKHWTSMTHGYLILGRTSR